MQTTQEGKMGSDFCKTLNMKAGYGQMNILQVGGFL
jgi:hypothetical protein